MTFSNFPRAALNFALVPPPDFGHETPLESIVKRSCLEIIFDTFPIISCDDYSHDTFDIDIPFIDLENKIDTCIALQHFEL